MANETLKLEEIIASLVVNLNNLKKNPNRNYLRNNLVKKQEFCVNMFKRNRYFRKVST